MEANELASCEPHSCAGGARIERPVGKRLTSAKVVSRGDKPLIVSSSSLPGDFFAEKLLVTLCMLDNSNEINTTALLDTGTTGYSFINSSMAYCVCDKLHIEPTRLSKLKAMWSFDGKQAFNVIHIIYPTMTVQDHRKSTTPMLITKLDQHPIILKKPWMKKHGVILDMRNDQLIFWPDHCQHVTTKFCAAESHATEPCTEEFHADMPRITILKQSQKEKVPEHIMPQKKKPSKKKTSKKTDKK